MAVDVSGFVLLINFDCSWVQTVTIDYTIKCSIEYKCINIHTGMYRSIYLYCSSTCNNSQVSNYCKSCLNLSVLIFEIMEMINGRNEFYLTPTCACGLHL